MRTLLERFRRTSRAACKGVLLGVIALSASAGPLTIEHVARDARWVAHLDVEALRASEFGRALLEGEHAVFAPLRDSIKRLQRDLGGIDPITSFLSATLYARPGEPERVVALFETTAVMDGVLPRLRTYEGFAELSINDTPLYTWRDHDRTWFAHISATMHDRRRLIVAEESALVIDALAVIRRTAPSLAGMEATLLPHLPAAGSFFFMAGEKPAGLGLDARSAAMLRLARTMGCDLGEREGRLFANLTLIARRTDDAREIANTMRGMVGMARQLLTLNPGLTYLDYFLKGLTLTDGGERIAVGFQGTPQGVIAALEAYARSQNPEPEQNKATTVGTTTKNAGD